VKAWLKRFSLHLAAAIGATGIFVAAAAVGASQTRQQGASVVARPAQVTRAASVGPQRKPNVAPSPSPSPAPSPSPSLIAAASPARAGSPTTPTPASQRVNPERSVSGKIKNVAGDGLQIVTNAGRELRVSPFPGALIRLNGKTVPLEQLQPGDSVVILGQAQAGSNTRFLAHAITARRT
jgi:hypothetical protein